MNFDNYFVNVGLARKPSTIIGLLSSIYQCAKQVQAVLELYEANEDPILTTVFETIFNSSEIEEFQTLFSDTLAGLIDDWEVNHSTIIQLG